MTSQPSQVEPVSALGSLVAQVQDTTPPRVLITASDLFVAEDLIVNGSFEDTSEDPVNNYQPTGWTIGSSSVVSASRQGPLASEDFVLPITGAHYWFLEVGGQAGVVGSQLVPMAPGSRVSLAGFVATSDWDGGGPREVTARLTPVAGTTPVGDPVTDTATGTWAWSTLSTEALTVPAGADGVLVEFLVNANPVDQYGVVCLEDITLSTVGPGGAATLYRVVDGARTLVRGALGLTPSGNALVVTDQETPFAVPVTWVLQQMGQDGTVYELASNTLTIETRLPWLTNPISGEGVTLTIAEWTETTRAGRTGVLAISGRAAPVVVADVRATPTSDLVVVATSRADLRALRDLLASGEVILVRAPCEAVETSYQVIGDVTETRLDPADGSSWRRKITLACQEVEAPDLAVEALGDTLQDLADFVPTTLADLAAAFGPSATLLTIAQTNLAAGGG